MSSTAELSLEPSRRPFVGRSAELDCLTAALADAQAGRGRSVLVTGEPGIGKTRIVEHLVAELPPAAVVWGRCHETEGAPAYWPWIQLARGLSRHRSPGAVLDLAGVGATDLAHLIPSLAEADPAAARLDTDPDELDGDPESARFRLFDAFATLVRRAGESSLTTFVLDDLQWADGESLLLLDYVASELRGTRVLLIGIYRDAELTAGASATRLLARVATVSERVALGGLTAQDVARLLTEEASESDVAPSHPSKDVGTRATPSRIDLVTEIHRATGGNPFFVGEIAELLRAEGAGGAVQIGTGQVLAFRVPDTVREAIRRRLDALPDDTRRALRIAAVLGIEAHVEPVAAIAETTPEAALTALEPALRSGLMIEGRRPGRYRFAHALLQDALLFELGKVERAEVELRAGEALERMFAADPSPILAELAQHFRHAAPLGGLPKAVEYATLAGDRAIGHLGFEEAVGHYERALESERGAGTEPQRRLELLLKLGDAQRWAGDETSAHATLHEAARVAREHGDAVALARAGVRVVAASAETGAVDRTTVELLEAALAALEPRDSALRAETLGALARVLYFSPDATRRDALSREALEVARRIDEPAVLSTVLADRHFALWTAGTVEERLALADEAIALAEGASHRDAIAEARAWRIQDLLELGRLADADRELDTYAAAAEHLRIPRLIWHATLVRAARALFDGQIDDAESLANRALRTRTVHPRNNALQFFALQSLHIRLARGELALVADDLARITTLPDLPPVWRCGVALMELARGRKDDACRTIDTLVRGSFTVLPRDATWLAALATLAELCDALDDAEHGNAVYAELLPHDGLVVLSGMGALINGAVARFLGHAALAGGRAVEAIRHLEDALAHAQRNGAIAELVRTKAALARAFAAHGSAEGRVRAETLAAEAQSQAQMLRAPGLFTGLRPGDASAGNAARAASGALREQRAPRAGVLRREGDFWTLSCGAEVARLRDTKGVAHLALLLQQAGKEIHALDLALAGTGERAQGGDAGESLDETALRAYRRRCAELLEEIRDADDAEAERLRAELESVERELARGTGLGGRARRSASDAERARLNVTRAIAAVLKKVAADCPELGQRLKRSVRTGTFCSYDDDPAAPIEWLVST